MGDLDCVTSYRQADRWACFLWLGLAAGLLASGISTTTAQAQGPLRVGEEVEVFFLRRWLPGTIVATGRRGEVTVEYEFAGRAQQRVFKRTELRRPYEADALTPGRSWSDASGQFNIVAALVSLDDEQVTLRKPDLMEVQVPINKLSSSDQSVIRNLRKELGSSPGQGAASALKGPPPPPLEEFSITGKSWSSPIGQAARKALTPDPLPSFLRLKEGGAAFPNEDFFDQIGAVLPIGGKDSWLLASLESNSPSGEIPTRLLWASLDRQKLDGRQVLPAGEMVFDYDPPTRRLLTYSERRDRGNPRGTPALTVWEVLPGDAQAKLIASWNVDPEKDRPRQPWSRLAGGTVVVQRYSSHEIVGWDVARKSMVYRISQESFFAPDPTLSGGRKYLFLPEDKGVRIFDSTSGSQVGLLDAKNGSAAVAISEDGRQAAVLGSNTVTIWDLASADAEPRTYQAEAIGTSFQANMRWLDDDKLIVDRGISGQILYSLEHELALWRYEFDHSAVRDQGGRRVREVVAGHFVYAATFSQGSNKGIAVGAVELPGPRVIEAAQSLDRDSLLILKPGARVRLDVRAGNDTAQVQAALASKIQANQWTIAPDAAVTLIAEMKRGEMQQVTYQIGFGRGSQQQAATVTPFISDLRLEFNGQVAWRSGTSTGAPPVVTLKEGQSVQNEVNRWQKPDVEFFQRVTIPERILDPAKRNGLGVTQVTNRGLVAK